MTTRTTPHVRLTVSDLKQQYLTGKITVKGYIYNWILASRKYGWRYKTKVKDFCQELGISRAAFYKAIAELKTEPGSTFHFEVPDGAIEMWIDDPSNVTIGVVYDRGHLSTNVDTMSTIVDGMSTNVDTMSTIVDDETPKPAHSKASTDPSTSSHLYTTYIHREEDGLNANNHETDLDMDNTGSRDPMDLRDPRLDEPDPTWNPDPTGDPESNPMRDPDPIGDPGSKFTQPAPSHLHKETMGSLGSNSMNGNSLSSRLDVKQILEETKRKLMEQVQWQRSQRMQRWATNVLPVGTQGSSLTPGSSDPGMTTTSTFRSSVKPVMRHLG